MPACLLRRQRAICCIRIRPCSVGLDGIAWYTRCGREPESREIRARARGSQQMPNLQQHAELNVVRDVRAYLNFEVGITHGEAPDLAAGGGPQDRLREQLAARDREISRLRANLVAGDGTGGIPPGHFIWVFGVARTGSSWLGAMMGDLEGHATWYEPYVGDVFGYAYYMRAGEQQRRREDYILGDPYREAWIRSLRTFVLEGADARFPELGENGYLVVKEPNGSVGAPLLVEALPESRVILLVRDPRDVVASLLAAQKVGSWGAGEDALADTDPDEFVRQRARMYNASFGKAWEAYEAHRGCKVATRYEDLRHDALGELEKIYSSLVIPIEEEQLRRVVEKYAWENIPERQKGPNKPRRKAKPGGWWEDLTPEQARMVEEITTPILDEFYPGWERAGATPSD